MLKVEMNTVDNLITGINKAHQSYPSEAIRFEISPLRVQELVEDHEELVADFEARGKENQESLDYLDKSIEAAQSVVDLLQRRRNELTGKNHVWLR